MNRWNVGITNPTPEASPSPTPGASPLPGIMPNAPAASPTEGKVLYGWPDTGANSAGVYSWDGHSCGRMHSAGICPMGFMHSGDVEIHVSVFPRPVLLPCRRDGGHHRRPRRRSTDRIIRLRLGSRGRSTSKGRGSASFLARDPARARATWPRPTPSSVRCVRTPEQRPRFQASFRAQDERLGLRISAGVRSAARHPRYNATLPRSAPGILRMGHEAMPPFRRGKGSPK